jgi:hypothetical protein
MFGYIRTHVPELRVREHECYRAVYCGLCREMGRCTGCLSRLTLSYDFVFLTLVRMAVTGEKPTFSPRRCAVHPLRKRPMMNGNEALAHSARCAALLNYWKVRDDRADERGFKRLRAMLIQPFMAIGRRRAHRVYGQLEAQIASHLAQLSALERDNTDSADLPANAFGALLRDICAYGLEGTQAKLAAAIGYHTGRWIYLIDALDDRAADAERGSYNPLNLMYGTSALTAEQTETFSAHLTEELMEIESALDLTDGDAFPEGMALLRNMLYLGMPRVAEAILQK